MDMNMLTTCMKGSQIRVSTMNHWGFVSALCLLHFEVKSSICIASRSGMHTCNMKPSLVLIVIHVTRVYRSQASPAGNGQLLWPCRPRSIFEINALMTRSLHAAADRFLLQSPTLSAIQHRELVMQFLHDCNESQNDRPYGNLRNGTKFKNV